MKKIIYSLLFLATATRVSFAQVVKIETLSTGLLYPVCIQNSGLPNDNRLFVVEKRGRIKIVDRQTGAVTPVPFLDIYNKVYPVASAGDERGLLGLAFHPDYANNGYFYVDYVNTAGKTIIARYQVSTFPDTAFTTSEQIIMSIYQPFSNHKGGNLMFGPEDGYLYISMGDGGSGGDPGNRAQNIDTLLGKTLRIDINNPAPPYYFSPTSNPFYGATPGRDEIFDWGLRNHWRCSFDRMKHDMWVADVGQNVVEEINFRSKCDTIGHNYGWRCYEGNVSYNPSGCQPLSNYTAPVFTYSHSLGCSVTGGYVYRGGHEGGLFGKYLFTDYCQGRIWATSPTGSGGWNTVQLPQSTTQINNNFSTFGEDVFGELYLAGVSSGRIYRLRDTACAPTAYINLPETLFTCSGSTLNLEAINGSGLSYAWTINSAGNWSVNAGQGSHKITASSDQNSAATIFVTVFNGTCSAVSNSVLVIPYASFSGLDSLYCVFSPTVTLNGFPANGSFSGSGISGSVFDPALAGAGTHTVQYSYTDIASTCYHAASGCILKGTKTVTVSICDGIVEQNNLQEVRVFPNPANSGFTLQFSSAENETLDLKITDALGREIFSSVSEIKKGKQDVYIKTDGFDEGVYFLQLDSRGSLLTEKIFIVR